jgi:RNA recognition motif-containing protein
MGFAFVEFKDKDVAKIAADNMNGYMLYGRKLVTRLIEDDADMKVKSKKFKFIPFQKIFVAQKNKVVFLLVFLIGIGKNP